MEGVLQNISGWASEVILIDSYSKDATINIALRFGIRVVQKKFRGFGDQWNFALNNLHVNSPWVMKLDPDERLSDTLKMNISNMIADDQYDAFSLSRRLWFMGEPLFVSQRLVRGWKAGTCRFSDVSVNEHPIVSGSIKFVAGDLEHHDSPNIDHWLEKQNRYTTSEAIIKFQDMPLSDKQLLFGTKLQRRMWLKNNFYKIPFRYFFLFMYHFFLQGAYRAGKTGYIWSRLRTDVMRLIDYKYTEMKITNKIPTKYVYGSGEQDKRVINYD